MNSESSETSEPHRFKLDLTGKLNLKNPNKNMAMANEKHGQFMYLLYLEKHQV